MGCCSDYLIFKIKKLYRLFCGILQEFGNSMRHFNDNAVLSAHGILAFAGCGAPVHALRPSGKGISCSSILIKYSL